MKPTTPILQIFFHNLTILTCTSKCFGYMAATALTSAITFATIWVIRNVALVWAFWINCAPSKFFVATGNVSGTTYHGVSRIRVLIKTLKITSSWFIHFTIAFSRHFAVTSFCHSGWSTCDTRRVCIAKGTGSLRLTKLCVSGPTFNSYAWPYFNTSACYSRLLYCCWPIIGVCWSRSHVFNNY